MGVVSSEWVAGATFCEQGGMAAVCVCQEWRVAVLVLGGRVYGLSDFIGQVIDGRTDLAFVRLETLGFREDVYADVGEAVLGPADGCAVEICESASFHFVADDGDVVWESACELVEAGDGEEEVLERVEGVVFGCGAGGEGVGGAGAGW